MLVVSRKTDESLIIADNIEITVLEISKDRVKIGVSAPRDIRIIRNELRDAQNTNKESSQAVSEKNIKALIDFSKDAEKHIEKNDNKSPSENQEKPLK